MTHESKFIKWNDSYVALWLRKSQSEWSGMCAMSALLGRDVECVTMSLQTHKPSRQEASPKEGQ